MLPGSMWTAWACRPRSLNWTEQVARGPNILDKICIKSTHSSGPRQTLVWRMNRSSKRFENLISGHLEIAYAHNLYGK